MSAASVPEVAGFEELSLIATGGFGAVYRAVDEHIGRVVAIKVLEGVNVADARARDRFLRETRAMGKLSGVPNIVDIYQATFAADGRPCIVMPLLTGGSLADVLAQRGRLSADEVITLGARIARALDAAHRRGISHRDIKPENILLDDAGEPGLADFGIAIAADTAASTRTRMSLTPEHAPPERMAPPAGEAPAESLGDIYSLASTLYTLVAGHNAFGSEAEIGTYEFIRRVVEQPAPALDATGVPPELDVVLRRALAKKPADRYTTALDFATALEAVPHTEQPVTRTSTAPAPLPTAPAAHNGEPLAFPDTAPVAVGENATIARLPAPAPASALAAVMPSGAASEAPGTVYRPRTPASAPTFPDEDISTGPPPWLVYVAVPVILLIGVIGFVVLRNSSDTPAPGAARGADPSSFGTAPVGTALVPASTSDFTVETIRALSDGGLAFTWKAPDLQADPAFQVSIDGNPAKPDFLATDPSTGQALQEQVVSEVTLLADGTKLKIDTAAHSYCVKLLLVGGTGQADGGSKCLDKGGAASTGTIP